MDVWASQFGADEPYETMEQAEDYDPPGQFEYRADKVVDGDRTVGVSTGRIFTWYYRKLISLCTIDPEYAKFGTEVEIIWGSEGKRQKRIRATVARYPYLDEDRNSDVDVTTIPRGTRD